MFTPGTGYLSSVETKSKRFGPMHYNLCALFFKNGRLAIFVLSNLFFLPFWSFQIFRPAKMSNLADKLLVKGCCNAPEFLAIYYGVQK